LNTAAPLLELSNAIVVRNGVRVLDGLTLTIRAGEHTAILGPNGSGKTSLIHLLTHDHYPLAPEDGEPAAVRVFGADRWNVEELRSTLGIVTTDLHQQFVEGHSAGRIRGIDAVVSGFFATRGFLINRPVTEAMRRLAEATLARLEVAHLSGRRLDEMSTGEARRVLIARALVARPRALILDEPTTGLDLVARGRFLDTVRRIAQEGTTIVLVTHHVEEIVPEIEHVVLLQRGRVAAEGPKREMLTAERLSATFGGPIALDQRNGYYAAIPITC
jgi:iron complex transport system ATP-binding protein